MKKRAYRKKVKLKLKQETIFAIVQIGFFLAAFVTLASFFSHGAFLTSLQIQLSEYFGWGKIFLPFILLLIPFVMMKKKLFFARPNILIGLILIWLTVLGLSRGGLVGLTVWDNFESFVGKAATILILLGALTIGVIVFLDTSIEEVMGLAGGLFGFIVDIFKGTAKILPPKKKGAVFVQDELPLKGKSPVVNSGSVSEANRSLGVLQKAGDKKNTSLAMGSTLVTSVPAQKIIWEYPPLSLLSDLSGQKADRGDMKTNAQIIERTLESFGIAARVAEINKGPAVTQYALEIAMGTKLSKITALQNDLALALAAPTGQIRIEAPIPGKSLVGVEIPNRSLEFVTLKTMLSSDALKHAKSKLTVALGLDVSGQPLVSDISKMPHVLIAGTTGSGKSVLINSWIASLLFRTTPEEVKLIMVDPKRVELVGYNDIPHLMTPVIVEADKTLSALKWAISEMERRYQEFSKVGVKNIDGYNELSGFQALPFIIIFIDELADLMAFAPVEVEDSICRLAQMARATGIHLILATQRPSVDVITGLIKANIPCRIAFNVSSMIDSRVVLDQPGAEKLLGRGDMLYIPPDQAKPTRIQGTYVSEPDIKSLVDFLKSKAHANYTEAVTSQTLVLKKPGGGEMTTDGNDPLFNKAIETVCQYKTASSSFLQRKFSIGFSRAARLLDQLEAAGVVTGAEGSKPRDVLIKDPTQFIRPEENV